MSLRLTANDRDRLGWHALRFTENASKVQVECRQCARPMWLPPSKVGEYRGCSPECNKAWKAARMAARTRPCAVCGSPFTPRQVQVDNGGGRFCSQACNARGSRHLSSPENLARAQEGLRRAISEGRVVRQTGPANARWKGGPAATLRRQIESGKSRAWLRKYRKNNPEKAREFSLRRSGRKLGRLPRGTIPRIGEAQRWRCAICRIAIRRGYHVDHIQPLKLGGIHTPPNIQLLCATCNLRKNAKDPLDYMREIGRLL